MEGIYDIYFGDLVIGSAKVDREGLYYRFDCRCRLEHQKVCKICVICEENDFSLGIPVPENGVFVLRTRLPVKRFGGGKLRFCIDGKDEVFIPVSRDQPFGHLKELKSAVFAVRSGQSGVVIKRKPDA